MNQHTKGPWVLCIGVNQSLEIRSADKSQLIAVIPVTGVDASANARLVMAAPNLLLACQGAITALLFRPHVDVEIAIDYLKEVLAQAQDGEAPRG